MEKNDRSFDFIFGLLRRTWPSFRRVIKGVLSVPSICPSPGKILRLNNGFLYSFLIYGTNSHATKVLVKYNILLYWFWFVQKYEKRNLIFMRRKAVPIFLTIHFSYKTILQIFIVYFLWVALNFFTVYNL